ncbi:cysteine proteinase [Neoconidiobolus thromboides FSU 785]|nr:cysteine proteinase [Neoconidiobolus thromboides FSU 785]
MRITTYEQQDAQEFFQILSDSLNEEDNVVLQTYRYSPLLDIGLLRSLIDDKQTRLKANKNTNKFPYSIRKDPLNGLLASRLSCVQCGYTAAIRHFSFNNISLSLPFRNSCTLEECLLAYVTIESLQEVVCRKCSLNATLSKAISTLSSQKGVKHKDRNAEAKIQDRSSPMLRQIQELTEALKYDIERNLSKEIKVEKIVSKHCTKQVMFAKAPPVLCLHLNRSAYFPNGSVTKNMCHVKFPEILDLSPFCTTGHLVLGPQSPLSIPEHTKTPSNLYRLQAVIVHYGSHSYGHFVTYRRKPLSHIDELDRELDSTVNKSDKIDLEEIFKSSSSEWYQVSDQSVLSADILDVLSSNPYMLLYELIPTPKAIINQKAPVNKSVETQENLKVDEVNGTNISSNSSPSPSTSSSGPPTPTENFDSDTELLGVTEQLLMSSSAPQSSGSSHSAPLELVSDMSLVD